MECHRGKKLEIIAGTFLTETEKVRTGWTICSL
jgi:hypothetical protein